MKYPVLITEKHKNNYIKRITSLSDILKKE